MNRVPRVLISLSGPFTRSDNSCDVNGTPSCVDDGKGNMSGHFRRCVSS